MIIVTRTFLNKNHPREDEKANIESCLRFEVWKLRSLPKLIILMIYLDKIEAKKIQQTNE